MELLEFPFQCPIDLGVSVAFNFPDFCFPHCTIFLFLERPLTRSDLMFCSSTASYLGFNLSRTNSTSTVAPRHPSYFTTHFPPDFRLPTSPNLLSSYPLHRREVVSNALHTICSTVDLNHLPDQNAPHHIYSPHSTTRTLDLILGDHD
jgi:hypothetical protein